MIQIYTGNGKGKTTASLGLAVRAAGHGFRVRIIQFLKGNTFTGELESLSRLGIEIYQFGRLCPHAGDIKNGQMNCQRCHECWIGLKEITELDRARIHQAWQMARESVEGNYDLIILDEAVNAINKDLLPLKEFVQWLLEIPDTVELVLTGRNAPAELTAAADLVSEIKLIKHPYQKGISARRGIEY